MKNPRLLTIFLIVFTGILGFSFILPLVPYYGDAYGLSDAMIGLLVASFPAAQFIGTPVLGRLSDRHGRRPILMVSVTGTVLSLIVFGLSAPIGTWLAETVFTGAGTTTMIVIVLFASRIMDGLTGGNISVAQAYITDETTEENRASGLALVGVAFGLGFVFGPATGGFLSTQFGLAIPALVAAGISTISLLLVILVLPESLPVEERADDLGEAQPDRRLNLDALRIALSKPLVGALLGTTFFFLLAFAILQGIFTLYALRRFGVNEQQAGLLLTYVGIISIIVQGGLIKPLTKVFDDFQLIVGCTGLMAVSLLGWGLAGSIPALLVVLAGVAASGGMMNVILRSALTKVTARSETGGVLGIQSALESLTRALGPAVGGWMLATLGTWAPGIFSGIELLILLPVVYVVFIVKRGDLRKQTQPASGSSAAR
ncbi:MAG: MFS transporter [Chloroflexi bacterium]|nr:MFS transporter [Chloroflexota bacterium]